MIDIKSISQNPQILIDSLQKRGAKNITSELLNQAQRVKTLTTELEALLATRNALARAVGEAVRNKQDATKIKNQVATTKQQETELSKQLAVQKDILHNMLAVIPNILHPTVPVGKDEAENVEIRKYLEPTKFSIQPKTHYQLGEELEVLDFSRATKISGSRFSILKGPLAKLERALINFMLDVHTQQHNFVEYCMPVLVNGESLYGTAQLPKFADDMFGINDSNKWLISTGEIPLTNYYKGEVLSIKDLPLRLTGVTQCFRKEAGSRGKDTKGMLRQHQFAKVEMVSVCHPEDGEQELEYLTSCAEKILQLLKLPYRVMLLCSGDTGFASSKTYDLEVWLPGENKYREISSCSLCTDFQARRLNLKVKSENNKPVLAYTLNGSGLAVGRTIIAIMENYQNNQGEINIPDVLIPYMGGIEVIKKV